MTVRKGRRKEDIDSEKSKQKLRKGRREEDINSEKSKHMSNHSETVHFLSSTDSCLFLL